MANPVSREEQSAWDDISRLAEETQRIKCDDFDKVVANLRDQQNAIQRLLDILNGQY